MCIVRTSRFDAGVFDMDGTLVDSEPLHYVSYQRMLTKFGKTMSEHEYDNFTGKTDAEICKYLLQKHSMSGATAEEMFAQKEKAYQDLLKEGGNLTSRPGSVPLIKGLRSRGLKTAVASSSSLEAIELTLKSLGMWDLFDVIASGAECLKSKPAPDVFHLAAKRLKIAPARCIAFEDSENGDIAADAAGMFGVSIPCGSTWKQDHSKAKLHLKSMEEFDYEATLFK
jgi:HAD superfamily hydrolase (TIGR01509 family)